LKHASTSLSSSTILVRFIRSPLILHTHYH